MNRLLRAVALALILGGTMEPVNWNVFFPWITTIVGFGGLLYWRKQAYMNQQRTEKKDHGSMRKKQPKKIEASNNNQEAEWLKKELEAKREEIKNLTSYIGKYQSLLDATTVSGQSYIVEVVRVPKKTIVSLKVGENIYPIIQQSQPCASYDLVMHPLAVAFYAAQTEKDRAMKEKLIEGQDENNSMQKWAQAALNTPLPLLQATQTTSPEERQKRFSVNTQMAINDLLSFNENENK